MQSGRGGFDKCEEGGERVRVIVQRPNPVPTQWWGRNSRCAVAKSSHLPDWKCFPRTGAIRGLLSRISHPLGSRLRMPHGNVSSLIGPLLVSGEVQEDLEGHGSAIPAVAAKSRSGALSEESLVCGWSLAGSILFTPFLNKLSLPGAPKAASYY